LVTTNTLLLLLGHNKHFPPFASKSIFLLLVTNLVVAGGFGSYMLAMDQRTYELIGPDYPGNRAVDVKTPSLGWMIGFMFVVSFLGLFSLVALRKVLIQHYAPRHHS
jgi:hypothetical protein